MSVPYLRGATCSQNGSVIEWESAVLCVLGAAWGGVGRALLPLLHHKPQCCFHTCVQPLRYLCNVGSCVSDVGMGSGSSDGHRGAVRRKLWLWDLLRHTHAFLSSSSASSVFLSVFPLFPCIPEITRSQGESPSACPGGALWAEDGWCEAALGGRTALTEVMGLLILLLRA